MAFFFAKGISKPKIRTGPSHYKLMTYPRGTLLPIIQARTCMLTPLEFRAVVEGDGMSAQGSRRADTRLGHDGGQARALGVAQSQEPAFALHQHQHMTIAVDLVVGRGLLQLSEWHGCRSIVRKSKNHVGAETS